MQNDHRLTSAQVRARYGNISEMTLSRWVKDPGLAFPKPEPIRSRNYWSVAELNAWDESRKQQLERAG